MLGFSLGPGWTGRVTYSGTYVYTLIGQSNMVGRAAFDGGAGHPDGVRQWGREGADDGVLVPASIPLQHHDPFAGDMGLDLGFTRCWVSMYPGAELIVVPSADGGTSLASGAWQKGGALYEDAVARTNAVMSTLPEASFAGFLWHQGEADTGNATYLEQLDQMIIDFRSDVSAAGPETPFVLGALSSDWVAGDPAREAIQEIIFGTPLRVDYTGVVPSIGLSGPGDALHFDGASLRALGTRYVTTLRLAASGQGGRPIATTEIPDQLDFATIPGGGGLAAPQALGQIPDQTDTLEEGLAAPAATGQIPDQIDEIAA